MAPPGILDFLEWYRKGYRYIAKPGELDDWKPCRTLKEASRIALAGRSVEEAEKAKAVVERLDCEIGFCLMGLWPFSEEMKICALGDFTLKDMLDLCRIAMNVTKRYRLKPLKISLRELNRPRKDFEDIPF